LFYVTAGIWSWFEYRNQKSIFWVILIGLFSGAAILVKWLTGLLVYSGWFLAIIAEKNQRINFKNYIDLLKGIGITILVFVPWQIYCLLQFPKESRFEFSQISTHFYEIIEGHDGSYLYHFVNINEIYGADFVYLIVFSFLLFCFIKIKKDIKIALISWLVITYLFFTIAATKMLAFTLIVAPLIYVIVGIGIYWVLNKIPNNTKIGCFRLNLKHVISSIILIFLFVHFINHDRLRLTNQAERKELQTKEISNSLIYKNLSTIFSNENIFYFNTPEFDHIKILFYSGNKARSGIPTQKMIVLLRDLQYDIVVFDNGKLPPYILNDDKIIKYKLIIWDY